MADAPQDDLPQGWREADFHRLIMMADGEKEQTRQRRSILRRVDVYDPEVEIDLSIDGVFTCLCPFNENIDTADVRVRYIPRLYIVELASLRDYLHMAFAHEKIAHEDVISLIWQDLMVALGLGLSNSQISVEMTFAAVEGVGMSIRKSKGYTSPQPPLLRSNHPLFKP